MIKIIPNWHPIFVHFSVALLTTATLLYLLEPWLRQTRFGAQLAIVARWNLWLGAAISIITVLFGFQAFYTVLHDDPAHVTMSAHRNWAIATLILFLGLAAWSGWQQRTNSKPPRLFLAMLTLAFAILTITAWHGAEVVFRHGIGVLSLPKPEGAFRHSDEPHAHSHTPKSAEEQ